MITYQKSPCCKARIRALVNASCRVDVDETGNIENLDAVDFDGVARDSLYCEACGENLHIERDGRVVETANTKTI